MLESTNITTLEKIGIAALTAVASWLATNSDAFGPWQPVLVGAVTAALLLLTPLVQPEEKAKALFASRQDLPKE